MKITLGEAEKTRTHPVAMQLLSESLRVMPAEMDLVCTLL